MEMKLKASRFRRNTMPCRIRWYGTGNNGATCEAVNTMCAAAHRPHKELALGSSALPCLPGQARAVSPAFLIMSVPTNFRAKNEHISSK